MRWKIAGCVFTFVLLIGLTAYSQDQKATDTLAPAAPAVPAPTTRIRVGGNVQAAKMIHQVQPVYPKSAKKDHIQGTVLLRAIIGTDGGVRQLMYVSGPPRLMKSSMDAVRSWKYQQTLLNGQPVEVETTIAIIYSLGS